MWPSKATKPEASESKSGAENSRLRFLLLGLSIIPLNLAEAQNRFFEEA
jgi:hypothetical protein